MIAHYIATASWTSMLRTICFLGALSLDLIWVGSGFVNQYREDRARR